MGSATGRTKTGEIRRIISTTMSLNVGDRRGHYKVTALFGEGGMGQVIAKQIAEAL